MATSSEVYQDGSQVIAYPDAVAVKSKGGPWENFVVCDDCNQAYLEPPYYTFDPEGCITEEITPDGRTETIHHDCTGNLCPECACLSEPDYADDPRRPRA